MTNFSIMKSVAMCGSRRFQKEARAFAQKLKDRGVTVFEPYFHSGQKEWEELSEMYQKFVALGLTHDHFYKINMADVVFVFNKDGYVGNSTTLEIGYAVGDRKPLYAFSDADEELCRTVLFRGFFDDPVKFYEQVLK